MVQQYAVRLCPESWRVPSAEDFCLMDKIIRTADECTPRSDKVLTLVELSAEAVPQNNEQLTMNNEQ
jgi:hypothetical protein